MAVFTVQLSDKVSEPAKAAAASVSGLSAQFDALQSQLAAIEAMQAKAFAHHEKAGTAMSRSQDPDILAGIKAQQQAALAGHDAERDRLQGLADLKKKMAADELAGKAPEQVAAQMAALQKASATADDALLGFTTQLGGIAQKAAPAAAAIGLVAAAVGKLAAMAISATQEKDALREMLGADTLQMVEDLSETSLRAFSVDQLGAWASKLKIAGYEGSRLKTAIEAVASSAARMKDGGAAAQGLLERLQLMADAGSKIQLDRRFLAQLAAAGLGVQDLAKALGVPVEKLKTMQLTAAQVGDAVQKALITKGAGALSMLGQTWDSIKGKVLEGIGDAFEDLGDLVHPFMKEVQDLASEFFKGGIASKGFAGIIKAILTPAFQFATQGVRWLHLAFLTLEVYTLRARVALVPVTNALDKIGASSALVSIGMYLLKGTVITLAVVFGVLALAVALCALPFVVAALAIYGVVSAISYLVDLIGGAIDHFDDISAAAAAAGQSIIDGLGNAISSGADWVVGLVKNLAASIIGAITGPLQIHSPSRVMKRLGGHITAGLVEGVEGGTPEVEAAAMGAGSAAVAGAATGGAGGAAGMTINFETGAIQITGAGGDVASLTEEAVAQIFERLRLLMGR